MCFELGKMTAVFETVTIVLLLGTTACAILELIPHKIAKMIKKSRKYRSTRTLLPLLAGLFVVPATVFRGIITFQFYGSYNTMPCLFVILTSVLAFFVTNGKPAKPAPITTVEMIKRRRSLEKSSRFICVIIIFIVFFNHRSLFIG
jgi:hypothetical protein